MFKIILFGCICFFCSFGIAEFFRMLFFCRGGKKDFFTVVPLLNNGTQAEGIIRNAFYGTFSGHVIAVDFGSADDTMSILNSLTKEYSALSAMTADEFLSYIKEYYNNGNEL